MSHLKETFWRSFWRVSDSRYVDLHDDVTALLISLNHILAKPLLQKFSELSQWQTFYSLLTFS